MGLLQVCSETEAGRLNDWLLQYPGPVGSDLETTGWSPDDGVSPVGRAIPWCMTLAWGKEHTQCFIPRTLIPCLRGWLESDTLQKVGTNLLGFDIHALRNIGINLSGILADTSLMSRLLDSRPEIDEHGGHGLKQWGARLGIETTSFEELVTVERTRTVPGKTKEYKRVGARQGTLFGGEAQEVHFKVETVELGLDEVWEEYPERRQAVMHYAGLDPVMSLKTYKVLRKKLEGRRW